MKIKCLITLIWFLTAAGQTARPQVAARPLNKNQVMQLVTLREPARTQVGPATGEVRVNPRDGLKYVWIPPGSFRMGCSPDDGECDSDEKPSHVVRISKGFWLGQTEVTAGAYKRFAKAANRQMPTTPFAGNWANENMPIVNVHWDDARQYCAWAEARLPTEAEWEYAARAASTQTRYGNLDDIAWNSSDQAHVVAQKRANGFGLFDMLGNAWEWVNDWYDPNYYNSLPSQDPGGPSNGPYRVLRGGSWLSRPSGVRISIRGKGGDEADYDDTGFRCAGE